MLLLLYSLDGQDVGRYMNSPPLCPAIYIRSSNYCYSLIYTTRSGLPEGVSGEPVRQAAAAKKLVGWGEEDFLYIFPHQRTHRKDLG